MFVVYILKNYSTNFNKKIQIVLKDIRKVKKVVQTMFENISSATHTIIPMSNPSHVDFSFPLN